MPQNSGTRKLEALLPQQSNTLGSIGNPCLSSHALSKWKQLVCSVAHVKEHTPFTPKDYVAWTREPLEKGLENEFVCWNVSHLLVPMVAFMVVTIRIPAMGIQLASRKVTPPQSINQSINIYIYTLYIYTLYIYTLHIYIYNYIYTLFIYIYIHIHYIYILYTVCIYIYIYTQYVHVCKVYIVGAAWEGAWMPESSPPPTVSPLSRLASRSQSGQDRAIEARCPADSRSWPKSCHRVVRHRSLSGQAGWYVRSHRNTYVLCINI